MVDMTYGASGASAHFPNPNMFIDTVDLQDRPVGVIRRRQAIPTGAGFRVAHAFILDSFGRLLLQEISRHHSRHAGYWGSSVAAYLFSGETYEQAIVRRLQQELGIVGLRPYYAGKTMMFDEGAHKFIALFTLKHEGPFTPDDREIEAIEFVSVEQIRTMHAMGLRHFTPTLLHLLSFYESLVGVP